MAHRLDKPWTDEEYANFVVVYNHQQGLIIVQPEETAEDCLYALEQNEIMVDGYPQVDPDYEEKQAQKERDRLDQLNLTKREVFLALLKDKGVTPEQIRSQITSEEALIEFDYSERFWRGNPLINQIGLALGYTTEQLDVLFEFGQLPLVEDVNEQTGE